MKLKFDVTAKEYGILRDILTDMLPPDSRVWVFGSRAKNTVRFNSDIDLALEPAKGKPLPKGTLARLKDAFNDAPLPYRVDVLDINDVSKEFQTIIRQQAIAFPLAKKDKVPKLRFPEFSGEWDSLKLGDIAAFSKGKGISKADIDEDGALECIRYGQLYTNYSETITDVKSRTNIPAKELVLSEANDIIIPASGETQIDIATASCVLKDGVALGGDLNIVKTEYDGVFLSYYLNSTRKYDIARLSQGISVVHLYAAQLKTLHLNLPVAKEQQKIASFLSAIDTKITQLTKKKTLLEQYKRGVMQQMFI